MKITGLDRLVQSVTNEVKKDQIVRKSALSAFTAYHQRIFNDSGSRDVNERPLGRYSEEYAKVRPIKFNRKPNPIILQATGQMKNDMKFQILKDGKYGYGFSNEANGDKMDHVQDMYNRNIADGVSKKEEDIFDKIVNKEIDNWLK